MRAQTTKATIQAAPLPVETQVDAELSAGSESDFLRRKAEEAAQRKEGAKRPAARAESPARKRATDPAEAAKEATELPAKKRAKGSLGCTKREHAPSSSSSKIVQHYSISLFDFMKVTNFGQIL